MDSILTPLFLLVEIYWIWNFHDKLVSMKTLRYFIHFSWFKHLFSKINGNHKKSFFCGGWKLTKLDFCIFSESLLERSHILTLFSSVFIFCCRRFMRHVVCSTKEISIISKKVKVKFKVDFAFSLKWFVCHWTWFVYQKERSIFIHPFQ